MITDIVLPKGNEAEFIAMAKRLGYDSLVFLYQGTPPKTDSSVVHVIPVKLVSAKEFLRQKTKELVAVVSSELDRAVLERGTTMMFAFELQERKDFLHQRASGLNHVLCQIAAKKNVKIGFSFSTILNTAGVQRAAIMGRMMQNMFLCKKYKTQIVIGSFATNPFEMRSPLDLQAFFMQLGLHPVEAKKAMQW